MENIRNTIETIILAFIDQESLLLINDSSEQSITHRLAILIENELSDWNVDCEYNRNQQTIKKLMYAISPNAPVEEKNVVPDLIVHKRMTPENLLVIEVKKSTNAESDEKDIAKLNAFKEQLGYEEALFIRFQTGEDLAGVKRKLWI